MAGVPTVSTVKLASKTSLETREEFIPLVPLVSRRSYLHIVSLTSVSRHSGSCLVVPTRGALFNCRVRAILSRSSTVRLHLSVVPKRGFSEAAGRRTV